VKSLETYGWNTQRKEDWAIRDTRGLQPARVIVDHGTRYIIALPEEIPAQLAGNLMHTLTSVDMPKIGDWVMVEHVDDAAIIHAVLTRTSEIVRGQAGRLLDKQVVAANVDVAFIVQPLDHDFSPERLERYLFQLARQNISCIIILNKADNAHNMIEKQEELQGLDAHIITMSALHDEAITSVEAFIVPGQTVVILGSSGAGKSTLTNRLLGEQRQATQSIRERDSKGRHTTVHRELFVLPAGGMIIDTPGIRELQLWGDEADLEASFPEIYEAKRYCHYSNCTHVSEARCAIKSGLVDGSIDKKRYRVYLNFKRELQTLESRRGFIEERRSRQSQESMKRRRQRSLRSAQDDIADTRFFK
jgi:ribosome biogenesis GTPase